MLSRAAGVVAAWALVANAFLLPPTTTDSKTPDLALHAVNPTSQTITLPCSECAFPTQQKDRVESVEASDDDLFWIQGGANSVVLDFTISEDGKAVQLNGQPIYPITKASGLDGRMPTVYVNQVPSPSSAVEIESGQALSTPLEITASGISVSNEHPASSHGDAVLQLRYYVLGLEHQPIHLDAVDITLLRTSDGEMLIMSLQSISNEDMFSPFAGVDDSPFPPLPAAPGKHHKECKMLPAPLCKFKNMVESKFDEIKHGHGKGHGEGKSGGCHGGKGKGHPGKLPSHIRPHLDFDPKPDGAMPPHGRPHHMRPHGSHHGPHGRFHHPVLHAFVKVLVAVLIPVMAGITVGLTVSLFGLLLGRLIGFLWINLVRGGRRGHASVAQQEVMLEEGEDKNLIAEMEAPPMYEDAPAYEDVSKEEK